MTQEELNAACRYANEVATKVGTDEMAVLWLVDATGGHVGIWWHPDPAALVEKRVEIERLFPKWRAVPVLYRRVDR